MKNLIYFIFAVVLLIAFFHIAFPHIQASDSQVPVLVLIGVVLFTVLSRLRLFAKMMNNPDKDQK